MISFHGHEARLSDSAVANTTSLSILFSRRREKAQEGGKIGLGRAESLLQLCFFDKLRFQLHRPDAVDLAVDIMIAIDQADVPDLCPDLGHR